MSVEQRCLRRHPAKTGFLRPLKSVCKTVSSNCPSSTISKWAPHTSGAPALHGAGSLRHFCLYPRPDSECEATRQPRRASPPVTGGQCGGTKSLFQSPHRPNAPLYLLLLRGGEHWHSMYKTEGTRTAETVEWACKHARFQIPRWHFTRMRLRDSELRGSARRGEGPPSNPVCLRLPPA